MNTSRLVYVTISLVLMLMLVGCRRDDTPQRVLPTATVTPTPYSTALAPVATIIPPGSETRALQMVVYSGSARSGASAATRIEGALAEQGLNVQILIRDRYAEVLAALCDSGSGDVSVAWLDGVTYAAARAENCGTPLLLTERDGEIGSSVDIVVNSSITTDNIFSLRESKYCRISYNDFATWLAPVLVFSADGLNPVTAFESITDYEDIPTLLQAVADGDCDMTSVPSGTLDDRDYAELLDNLRVLETSVAFPYNILMIPLEVPLDIRLQLIAALETIADDTALAGSLRALIDQEALLPMESDTLDDFHTFIDSTGLDFAQLGS
ncbi:MAG: PhnD/SsuA/transferrin family substrate-binding protein [Anaerolineae bacterium]